VIEKELMYLIRGLFVRFDSLKEQVLGFFVETRLDSSIFPEKNSALHSRVFYSTCGERGHEKQKAAHTHALDVVLKLDSLRFVLSSQDKE
jgi:hypothetical protein